MLALVHAIKALPQEIRNGRLDAYVDSQVMIGAWNVQGSKKSRQLTRVTKQLVFALSSLKIQLSNCLATILLFMAFVVGRPCL